MKSEIILIAERREDHGVKFHRDPETEYGDCCYQHAPLESSTDAKSKTPKNRFEQSGRMSIFCTPLAAEAAQMRDNWVSANIKRARRKTRPSRI
jgi:hypothetical protein